MTYELAKRLKRKEIRRKANKKYRLANQDKVAKMNKDYQQSEAGKASMRRSKTNMLIKYPEKAKAREKLNDEIKAGRIIKPTSCSCGAIGVIHGHHFDYSKPLEVVWVCTKCHAVLHKSLEELIEACQLGSFKFELVKAQGGWFAKTRGEYVALCSTPIEAVARLWLALHTDKTI